MTQDPPSPVDPWQNFETPVEEDMRFQRGSWKAQRAGWGAMTALLAAAALGVFSEGPLSWTRTQGQGVAVEHQRTYRNAAPSHFILSFAQGGAPEREVVISHDLLRNLIVEMVNPAPVRSETRPDGLHLTFAAPEGGPQSKVYVHIRPDGLGPLTGQVSLAGQEAPARLQSFILP